MKTMKVHPFARTFETLSKEEMTDLREDIKTRGIVVPLIVNKAKDTIIDGRNRWMIATELGLKESEIPMVTFDGPDDEIKAEILRLNVFRRHLTEDQRVAAIAKVRGPMLEKEAKERQAAAPKGKSGSFKNGEGKTKGTTVAQIASESKSSTYKAGQAEKARKAGVLDDVIAGKKSLKQAAKSVGTKKRKPLKTRTFEDEVWMAWARFLKKWPQTQHRDVIKHVQTFIEDRRPADAATPSDEKAKAEKAAAAKSKTKGGKKTTAKK